MNGFVETEQMMDEAIKMLASGCAETELKKKDVEFIKSEYRINGEFINPNEWLCRNGRKDLIGSL